MNAMADAVPPRLSQDAYRQTEMVGRLTPELSCERFK